MRLVGFTVAFLLSAAGCTQAAKKAEFNRFAKDYSLAIRAQQVIPIYPLQESLKVGDVFLVDRPIEDEPELYDETGFLPLGQYLSNIEMPVKESDFGKAVFATFTFDIRRGQSVGGGLPISGVPVAFSLTGAQSATASVSLKDATSYRVPEDAIDPRVKEWGKLHQATLKDYAPRYVRDDAGDYQMRYRYARVVTGIWRVKRASVVMNDTSSTGGKIRAGVADNLGLLTAGKDLPEDVTKLTNAVNAALANATAPKTPEKAKGAKSSVATTTPATAPAGGGAAAAKPASQPADDEPAMAAGAQFSAYGVTNSSVSLDETFEVPVVVGYVAVDVPIDYDGSIGSHPTETRARVNLGGRLRNLRLVDEWIQSDPNYYKKLQVWATGNAPWLKGEGLVTADGHPLNATDLERRITNRGFLNSNWLVGAQMKRLCTRILNEVVMRPEGLPPIETPEDAKKLSDTATFSVGH
ncbi:MAG: hypothetical protein JWO31_1429 [Phycisphaerales bacterium]|nr:hypothetical protein [Phycisphaerales bacterium]